MEKRRIERPDGRYLYYYAFDRRLPAAEDARNDVRPSGQIELRRNELLDEWVIVSTERQERTFLPPPEYCPLCATEAGAAFATEIPANDFEFAVFENRWPSFRADAPDVTDASPLERRGRAAGACEVIVYSPAHDGTLASMPHSDVRHLVDVWADRYADLGARDDVDYVFIFENRGEEIGVTLTHPHGQIYAFPFVPPRVEREHAAAAAHGAASGGCLQCDVIAREMASGDRIVLESDGFVAYVPFAARVPYEVHVAAKQHRPSLLELDDSERDGLAVAVRALQATYDALWGFAMPYTMSMHQRATSAHAPDDHLHIEFLPPYRARDKLKYLAGVETGAGTFINDTAPEEKARELREARERAGV